jgi:predicted small lipoprotein YifL
MKLSHKYPLVILLAIAIASSFAITGCKKKPPVEPAPAPVAEATDATNASNDQQAAAQAPADAGTPAAAGAIPLTDPGAFHSSDPKLQGLWDGAIAAAQTNSWYNTYVNLKTLRSQPGLDDTQTQYLDTTISTLGKAMVDAANKGDKDAMAAFIAYRRNRGAPAQ